MWLLLVIVFVINFCVNFVFIWCCMYCFNGWVLYIGLKFVFIINFFVVFVNFIVMWWLVRWFCSFFIILLIMFLILFVVRGLNKIILFIWFKNLGWKCFFNCFIIRFFDFFLMELFFFNLFSKWVDLIFEVIIIIVFLKFIVWFCEFVMCLLFNICNKMLNIFGCVFLILFNKIMEYGLCFIVFVNWLFFLYFIYLGGVLIKWDMVCFFIYLDMLMWIICFLLLNKDWVNVFVSFVLLIFVGFKKMKELIGWFGFLILVWVWRIVFDIKFIVFFCLMICFDKICFKCNNFLCLFFMSFVIGILV